MKNMKKKILVILKNANSSRVVTAVFSVNSFNFLSLKYHLFNSKYRVLGSLRQALIYHAEKDVSNSLFKARFFIAFF